MRSNQRPSRPIQTKAPSGRIRILATTDLHMNLTSFDYYSDKPDPTLGLTRTASLIRAARRQAEDDIVLLFDNGDSLQGTPLGEWAALNDGTHPMMQAFEALGYDAIGLGNHDFGFGLNALDRILAQAPCPVLCSNLHRQGNSAQRWQDHVILDRIVPLDGQNTAIRVGVFSVLPPQTNRWEAHHLQGKVTSEDILSAAQKTVTKLQGLGCDLIVALAHSGLGQTHASAGLENAVIPLAAIEGVDAIVAGHTHLTLPGAAHESLQYVDHLAGLVHGKPVIMPGSAGSHLGVVDLSVTRNSDNKWHVEDHCVELRSIHSPSSGILAPEDQDIVHLITPGHTQTRAAVAKPVARVAQDMHSYFSFCAPDRGLALVAAAQAAALRPFLRGTASENLPMLSAASPYKCGARSGPRYYTDVPAGEICLRHIADLHVFPNELRAIQVNGAQVLDWLEMSAGTFNQVSPGTENNLMNPGRAGHNFDVLFGLSYQIDPSKPPRFDADGTLINPNYGRIKNATFEGNPLRPDQKFVVALNNYRANGGGHFPFIANAQPISLPPLDIKSALRDYLSKHLPADPMEQAPYPFAILPLSGACAILRTGQGALRHLGELDVYSPQVLGTDADGFVRIRLTL
ncbi:bifunctional 2',3'-cyclic-nucleotide 2'-phosphodiesterase/3'-nucleotidase [uncultured Ruegeria sp.]|uniref:bifunctional 2',3'-cyclic-nucleotide 2'-phosphodiesterase/3'-nucleotidase n=1 Tax=uncultured Ruegeria sp. TaxID=259304 RepID=UPI00261D4129|nr:bifunctional 2',3'-cyclic-nucleotide 2'-phosphodiesterase/3'-nucleotidase [uncultured Ruegeria sp.]